MSVSFLEQSAWFSDLDHNERKLLEDLSGEELEAFRDLQLAYAADFQPAGQVERDTLYMLCCLRRSIYRVRESRESLRCTFAALGIVPKQFRDGVKHLESYERELCIRYEQSFSHYMRVAPSWKREAA